MVMDAILFGRSMFKCPIRIALPDFYRGTLEVAPLLVLISKTTGMAIFSKFSI
jgi:hypothetical protein